MKTKLGNKINIHENEIIYYEEDKITVLANTRPSSAQYTGSMITITNHRIILSQKMLFGGYQIRYMINLIKDGPDFSIKGGYVTCNSKKEDIKKIDEKKTFIQIETSGGDWVGSLNVYTQNPDQVLGIVYQ